jgi:hypothetical protein
MSSLVSGSSALDSAGANITCLTLAQVRSRRSGWLARARQKLLMKSDFRVTRMLSKTAWRRGLAEISASVRSFCVGMVYSPIIVGWRIMYPASGQTDDVGAMSLYNSLTFRHEVS